MPDRDGGKHMIDQMGGRVRHPASTAGGAGGPALTGERQQLFFLADLALKAKKTARQYAAFEHAAKFAFNKCGHIPALLFLPGQKRFEIFLKHAVDEGLVGLARAVLSGGIVSRTTPRVAQSSSTSSLSLIVMPHAQTWANAPPKRFQ